MTNEAPLVIHTEPVRPEWVDYNGHMNVAFYNLAFDHALDALFDSIGVGVAYRYAKNCSMFVIETHVTYRREVVEGDPLRIDLQLLDLDAKRVHYFLRMFHAEKCYLAATSEQLSIHVDLKARRSAPLPSTAYEAMQAMMNNHRKLARPAEAGSVMGIRRLAGAAS